MFPSLGYVLQLRKAAERGESKIESLVDVGTHEVTLAVEENFPSADSYNIISGPTTGAGGITFIVQVPDGGKQYVLKFVPELLSKKLRKGVEIYRTVTRLSNIPTPDVYAAHSEGSDIDYPYSLVEYVEGDEITRIRQFKNFPREAKKNLLWDMGQQIGKLHTTTKFDTYGDLTVENEELTVIDGTVNWDSYYCDLYADFAADAKHSETARLAEKAAEFFAEKTAEIDEDPQPTLVHNDFTPDNLITADGDIQAVLDWEEAMAGSPAREFWQVEENIVNIFRTPSVKKYLRTALYDGYSASGALSPGLKDRAALFSVGEFTKVDNVHSILMDLDNDFDSTEFLNRAEAELESRIEKTESRLS